MRCPRCDVFCSDLREKCPNCGQLLIDPATEETEPSGANPYHRPAKGENTPFVAASVPAGSAPAGTASAASLRPRIFRGESDWLVDESSAAPRTAVSAVTGSEGGQLHDAAAMAETAAAIHQGATIFPAPGRADPLIHEEIPEDPVETLFREAERELAKAHAEVWELSFSSVAPDMKWDEVNLLFDLADESLRLDGAVPEYVEQVSFSHERHVDAAKLEDTVQRVNQVIERQLAVPTTLAEQAAFLHRPHERLADGEEAAPEVPRIRLRPASRTARAVSACFDFCLLNTVAFLIALGLCVSQQIVLPHEVLGELQTLQPLTVVALLWRFLAVLLALSILYPFLSVGLGRRTIGMALMSLRVVSVNGSQLEFPHLVVRSLCQPLAFLCGGWLTCFSTKRGLHDRWAHTIVIDDDV